MASDAARGGRPITRLTRRPRLAVVATVFRPNSHADVMLSRWFEARPSDASWGWRGSQCEIAALFTAQTPDNDMARAWCEKYGVQSAVSIKEALTLGGDNLAVDGVLLIAEHGDYLWNEKRQRMYPRREFFDEIVAVFRASGRVVPLFVDKHLSWNSQWAIEMAQTIRELEIPFLSGSSLPHVGFRPVVPLRAEVAQGPILSFFPGGAESYGYHSIEIALRVQAMLEREAKLASVTVWHGEMVWQQIEANAQWRALAEAILPVATRFGGVAAARAAEKKTEGMLENELLFRIEFADGNESLHLRVGDGSGEFSSALRRKNGTMWTGRVASGGAESFYGHFATQNALIEEMMLTGHSTVPLDRSLGSTLLINRVMDAVQTPGVSCAFVDASE